MAQYVYIKVSNDKYRHIVAMADTATELAEMLGITPTSVVRGVNIGRSYEKVLIAEDTVDYQNYKCRDCKYLNKNKPMKFGYYCENDSKTWYRGASRDRVTGNKACKCFEKKEGNE